MNDVPEGDQNYAQSCPGDAKKDNHPLMRKGIQNSARRDRTRYASQGVHIAMAVIAAGTFDLSKV